MCVFDDLYMIHAVNETSVRELLTKIPTDAMVITTQEFVRDILEKEFSKTGFCKCTQALCTRKEALPVKYKDIRVLDGSYFDYVMEHYNLANPENIRERLNAGAMYGAFDDEKIIGFVGVHNEGSMGMLFVEEEYRHKGIGASLESYLINLQISNGFTPYCHIIEGNQESYALQEKLGLYMADTPLWWIW